VHREDQHLDLRVALADLTSDLHAVDEGDRIVEDGDIRLGVEGLADRFLAVGRPSATTSPSRVSFGMDRRPERTTS